eukprot:3402450-Ditylum_brightwellii.AAC.1
MMGLIPYPYITIKSFLWGNKIIRGNYLCPNNPLYWDIVNPNLPGNPAYVPIRSKVVKWSTIVNRVANNFITYFDNIRKTGNSKDACFLVTHRVMLVLNYLEQQDSPQKHRHPSQQAGLLAGVLSRVIPKTRIFGLLSWIKWDKLKFVIRSWYKMIVAARAKSREPEFDQKLTEKDLGFVIPLTMTYLPIGSYLKGIHLTLDSWHLNQDKNDWQQSNRELMSLSKHLSLPHCQEIKAPKMVRAVPRLKQDLEALLELTNFVKLPLCLI